MPTGVLADCKAHPRVSGENHDKRMLERRAAGSSPRERGKLATLLGLFLRARLIPA